jgi:hypothetical protein
MKVAVVDLVALFLVVSSLHVLTDVWVTATDDESPGHWTVLDTIDTLKANEMNRWRNGEIIEPHNSERNFFSYENGPYPIPRDDGSYTGVQLVSGDWGDNYVSEVMYSPPHNAGGGYSPEATGGAGDFTVGDTHESTIGDQNGNGVLEWISYYSYRPWGEDGIDNDGDGCVDEKSFGDWDGQIGCDRIPDQYVYFAIGGLPDSGGKLGTLAVTLDWYTHPTQYVTLHRIFAMQPFETVNIPLTARYPQIVDNEDIISYYGPERENAVNANPEMDSDLNDWFVGSIDARDFPSTPATNHVCFAGYRLYMGISSLRPDGHVVTSFELHEEYDGRDWNGDSDKLDVVAAYYVVDPADGSCDQGVNGGVQGIYPRNSGKVLTPSFTLEDLDGRDWNGDGDKDDDVRIWHDIDSTWDLVGHRYTSVTFTSSPGAFGVGFWGLYSSGPTPHHTLSLKFGGAYGKPLGGDPSNVHTYFFLISEEDGDPQTILPEHHVGFGYPGSTLVKACIHVYARENRLEYEGVKLIGGQADGNGDGDTDDTLNYIYCPNEKGGGGEFVVEPTSKYARGLYEDPIPFIWAGNFYYESTGDVNGYVVNPAFYQESQIVDDADGDLVIDGLVSYHIQYWVERAELKIDEAIWIGDASVQPGGNVVGRISLLNVGQVPVILREDTLLYTDDNHWLQGLHLKDLDNENGILEPDEIADVYFALRLGGGTPVGLQTIHIMVVHGNLFLETYMPLEVSLKMEGNDLACYRLRQNALRAMRSFDMDDDWDMLHDLEPGGFVDFTEQGAGLIEPEDAVMQLVSWYAGGCENGVGGNARVAHSAGMMLTTKYGMGIDYWGFAPGQEEGNEGNGNGGLTGNSRKEVYGF